MDRLRNNYVKWNKNSRKVKVLCFFICDGCKFKFVCMYMFSLCNYNGDYEKGGRDIKGGI